MLLKDGMGLKMESFNIIWVHWKIDFLGGSGGHKKIRYRENCLKRGAWTVCRFKGGGLAKKGQCALCRLLALSRLRFSTCILWTSMIDFSTNKYIQNIQIKHLNDTYICLKQQIKLFSLNNLLKDKLYLKNSCKMLS